MCTHSYFSKWSCTSAWLRWVCRLRNGQPPNMVSPARSDGQSYAHARVLEVQSLFDRPRSIGQRWGSAVLHNVVPFSFARAPPESRARETIWSPRASDKNFPETGSIFLWRFNLDRGKPRGSCLHYIIIVACKNYSCKMGHLFIQHGSLVLSRSVTHGCFSDQLAITDDSSFLETWNHRGKILSTNQLRHC